MESSAVDVLLFAIRPCPSLAHALLELPKFSAVFVSRSSGSSDQLSDVLLCFQAIGFDMDYTLAQYRPETFEKLAYHLTVDNLVKTFGYPKVSSCLTKQTHAPTGCSAP